MDLDTTQISARIQNKKVMDNTIILANMIELSSSVVAKLANTSMSSIINNAPVTKSTLATLVSQRIGDLVLNHNVMTTRTY